MTKYSISFSLTQSCKIRGRNVCVAVGTTSFEVDGNAFTVFFPGDSARRQMEKGSRQRQHTSKQICCHSRRPVKYVPLFDREILFRRRISVKFVRQMSGAIPVKLVPQFDGKTPILTEFFCQIAPGHEPAHSWPLTPGSPATS